MVDHLRRHRVTTTSLDALEQDNHPASSAADPRLSPEAERRALATALGTTAVMIRTLPQAGFNPSRHVGRGLLAPALRRVRKDPPYVDSNAT